MKIRNLTFALLAVSLILSQGCGEKDAMATGESPRIINVINFIRQTDYRLENSDSLMFDAVVKQIDLVNKYGFPATFLFQYDALINPAYQELMETRLSDACEIGAWWEITQPHVEAAGMVWRGRHPWVSTANIAFTTGYTPEEREKLVDVYMAKFKEIYGVYPRSVGSWFIDSYTLNYMHKKYGIVASCNCKDQVGTDGYTLWGGYWNQAYYPSLRNAYMPAQTKEGAIPVPIFRMLGSDPIYQYDTGVGGVRQGVISLEPVYTRAGKNRGWVEYFLDAIVNRPSLAFNYAQAGQENSFTWSAMGEGLEMQFPIFDSLRKAGKIRMETLGQSGEWFRGQFEHTPPTAVTAMTGFRDPADKTVWFNSRYYRANLFWEKDGFRFRDIHLFDENFESSYFKTAGTGDQFLYYTLPVVDGFFWSTAAERAGLRFMRVGADGNSQELVLTDPVVNEPSKGVLRVESPDASGNKFVITFSEDRIEVSCDKASKNFDWTLELKVPQERLDRLPFTDLERSDIKAEFNDYNYTLTLLKGSVRQGNNTDHVFRLIPAGNKLVIDCKK